MILWKLLLLGGSRSFSPLSHTALPGNYPTVDLGYARYVGTSLQPANVNQWSGIRFAAPPTGERRWRAPSDPFNERILQDATFPGANCIGSAQPDVISDTYSEDCLFIDVYAPKDVEPNKLLPVWFYIQGGGYAENADITTNGTDAVVRSNHSVVFVKINYRVGAFGFLASEKIRANGDLNVGLLDQRKALQWVQRYIHHFGGDPDHVVIHGASAGAGSVAHHLTAYGGRDDGLFVGAMAESTFWPTQRSVADMEFQFDAIAKNVSCPNNSTTDTLACLRSIESVALQRADVLTAFPGAQGVLPKFSFLPVIDGDFSRGSLYDAFAEGNFINVPLVVGDDTDEGTFFAINANTSAEFLGFVRGNFPKLSSVDLQQINQSYPEDITPAFTGHGPYFPATAAAYGEATFICPGLAMSRSTSSSQASSRKVWNYRYNAPIAAFAAAGLGVFHVSERLFVFGCTSNNPCGDMNSSPAAIMDYWTSFVLSLDPNLHKRSTASTWDAWDVSKQRLRFDTNASVMEDVPTAQVERCKLWESLHRDTEQ